MRQLELAGERMGDLRENFPQGRARDLAAAQVGISGRTLEKAMAAIERRPELEEKLKSGEISVHRAYTMANAKGDERRRKGESGMMRTCFLLTKEEYEKIKAMAHKRLLPLPKFLRQLVRGYLDAE